MVESTGRGSAAFLRAGSAASVVGDKSQRVIYEIGCFNKPSGVAQRSVARSLARARASARVKRERAAFRNGVVIFIREIYYLQFELNEF